MSNIIAIVEPKRGEKHVIYRLIQRRDAIVDSVAGVTRDRHYGKSDWNGKEFSDRYRRVHRRIRGCF